jgi:hypothetical protein
MVGALVPVERTGTGTPFTGRPGRTRPVEKPARSRPLTRRRRARVGALENSKDKYGDLAQVS